MRNFCRVAGALLLVLGGLTVRFVGGQQPSMATPPERYLECNKPGPACPESGPIIGPCTSVAPPCPNNYWKENVDYLQCNDQYPTGLTPCEQTSIQCGWTKLCQPDYITDPPYVICVWGPKIPATAQGCGYPPPP